MSQHPTCETHNHECKCSDSTARQSLEEMDFERGIWSAAQQGDIERVKKLTDNWKFDVDQRDSAGYTALHYAARNGHLSVCEYLVQKGADVDATTKSGLATALHRAVSAGKIQIVDFLLSKKANVNLRDVDGKTTLHRASENNHKSICKLLVTHYPHLKDVADNKGNKPQNVS